MSADDISKALKSARYNETVQIGISNDGENNESSSSPREITLVACLDEEQGGIQWNDLSTMTEDDNVTDPMSRRLERHLRTKRWIFPMLNDHKRNELYNQAIQQASQEVAKKFSGKDTFHALDIGSGTGLLAMMSAKHLKKECTTSRKEDSMGNIQVTSLEMSTAMAKLAQQTVCSNHLQNQVHVVEGHSCEIPTLESKAQLCTCELLESGLLAEGWLPALRDAWERHLDPGAVVVPQRARIYAQVAEGDGLAKYWGPHSSSGWLQGFPDDRTLRLSLSESNDDVMLGGTSTSSAIDGVQVPIHINQLLTDEKDLIRLLSDPIQVLEIGVSKDSIPPPEGQTRTKEFIPTASGRAQGVIFWWELDLYGDALTYSTQHGKGPWQDHWHQCIFVFTKPNDECTNLVKGQPATIKASHDDSRISFTVAADGDSDHVNRDAKRFRPQQNGIQALVSSERAWQLNDLERLGILRDGLSAVLEQKGNDAFVLDLSDFSLCAILAALLGARRVTSLESSGGHLPMTAARVAQLANGLPLPQSKFEVVQCHAEQLTVDIIGGKPAEIVVAEPFYEILEGWHLQEALNYFYTLRALKTRGVVTEHFRSVPTFASVMACAFESKELSGAYSGCQPKIRGFNHDIVNQHGRFIFSKHDLSIPTWQYNLTELTEAVEVARIDYESCCIRNSAKQVQTPFQKPGTCHGMLLWIDYGIPNNNNNIERRGGIHILSTRGRSYHQVVRMLPKPITIDDATTGRTVFCCKAILGSIAGQLEDHQFELSVEKAA